MCDSCDVDRGVKVVLGSSTTIWHHQRDRGLPLLFPFFKLLTFTNEVQLDLYVHTQRNSDMLKAKASKA